jgi:hypothetical protein
MAMQGRPYSAPINIATAFTAQIDIFELLAGTNKPLRLLGFDLAQTSEVGDAQEEWLTLVLKRVTGAPTSGSGGGTSTFAPLTPNDAAAGATLETGNTTKLTGGTSVEVKRIPFQVRQGVPYVPIPEAMGVLDQATRFVLELVTTPADSISAVVGGIDILELV